MKTSLDCIECNIKQLVKLSRLVNATDEQKQAASKETLAMLSHVDFDNSNPYIMGKTWEIATRVFEEDNPYKEVKAEFNQLLLSAYDDIQQMVEASSNSFMTGLKVATVGNIIDFAARHKFTKQDILTRVQGYKDITFAIDSSEKLVEKLKTAKSLFYIGDNCGEIVLDKLFIEQIKKENPQIDVHFGVRGDTILNDVTSADAEEVGMSEVATVVSSGTQIPGTVLKDTTEEFQKLFYESDIVIAKGQGNFESLSDTKRENLYLLLMAKCFYVAETIGCNTMDYIAKENC